jgi:energy-coupling factor transporter ATP-binding protein EcfA2
MTLQGRPLYDNGADARLFVHRSEWARLHRALDHSLNVLIAGKRGNGKTSLLRQIQYVLRKEARTIAYVDATAVESALELASRIRAVVAWEPSPPVAEVAGPKAPAPTPDDEAYGALRALSDSPKTMILVDASEAGRAVYDIFGRMRDVIWQLPHQWAVAVDTNDLSIVLRPPADAFFDLVLETKPWETPDLLNLLEKRAPDFDVDKRVRIVACSQGSPRVALRALRDAIIEHRDPEEALSRRSDLLANAAKLGRPHGTVLAALLDRGPSSPSDATLQSAAGLSRGRLAAILGDLVDHGLAVSRPGSSSGPGRPRTVYAPNLEDE